jgi:serine/threonine protein kinase
MRSNLEDGGVALMMEYMNGGSLQDIVNDGGCQDEGTLASIALQVLTGLDFLHRCNQIHRDIKPANILINSEGSVKVSDLGILKQLDPTTSNSSGVRGSSGGNALSDHVDGSSDAKAQLSTILEQPDRAWSQEMTGSNLGSRTLDLDEREIFRANTFVGTLTYMAPERIDGRSYTFNSDVWSFGLTLLAVAQGKLPIDQSNGFWSILNCVRDLPPPSLPRDGTWSDECVDFIAQCLIQRPAKRPSCSELLKHPFLKKAVVENYDELTVDISELRDSRIDELRSIIEALYLHLKKLRADFDNVRASRSLSASQRNLATVHILSQAIDSHGENEVLKFLLFGTPLSYRHGNTGSGSAAASGVSLASSDASVMTNDITFAGASERLQTLSRQLYIPLETTIEVAKAAYKDLINGGTFLRPRANSNALALSSRPTPTNPRNLRRFSRDSERDEGRRPSMQGGSSQGTTPSGGVADPMHFTVTPKSRHDETFGRK